MTTADAVVETLLRHGIEIVYGLPGLHNDPLFDALYRVRDRLRVTHTRHEQGAAYMALGAAVATGKPQVCILVPGPGLLNASAALLTALGMNAPVIAVVGQIPLEDIDRGLGYLHEIRDQPGLARHIAKYAARITSPQEAPGLLAEAFTRATSGRPGPVVVECPMDVWARSGHVTFPTMPVAATAPEVDHDAVSRAADVLGRSVRPLIVVGGGAQGASSEVVALAEMLEAPVVAYRRGQGIIPSTHRLHVNLPVAHRLWRDVDCVLGIGTRLFIQQTEWGLDGRLDVVRIDIDPEEPARFAPPTATIVGDAASSVSALLERLPSSNRLRACRDGELAVHRAAVDAQLAMLEPQVSFLRAIRAALPEQGVLVDDVSQMGFASRLAFPVLAPRTFLSPGYQDTLGWGLGAALGAKSARPDVPVVAMEGDGGLLFQSGELATAVQHGIAVVVVVFDNGQFGNVRLVQQAHYCGHVIAADLVNPDFVRLAEAYGLSAYRADSPEALQPALADAIARDRPALIHVRCGSMPSPWDMIRMPRVRP
jgi:acetolactate synthase-1/2/3 large subunit